uniref:Uncharacterized protein n=1 Tax=Anopheles minimus TaxID=112268 RepID=A0A182VWS1_9DIPT
MVAEFVVEICALSSAVRAIGLTESRRRHSSEDVQEAAAGNVPASTPLGKSHPIKYMAPDAGRGSGENVE